MGEMKAKIVKQIPPCLETTRTQAVKKWAIDGFMWLKSPAFVTELGVPSYRATYANCFCLLIKKI